MLIKSLLLLLLQSCFSDHKKASNLEAYVEWFNRLSYLVATEICMVSNERQATLTLKKSSFCFAGAKEAVKRAAVTVFFLTKVTNKKKRKLDFFQL